ncbi:40S ribosomal protein S15a-1 [Dichanthelium oligosanthes]|uniref:Small ribosomal subunit protein uS8c n=1 Tax=Dichanthelium oligosanthes TaxID=888268 RepID=A0A1E5VGR8_9POAL|nr:40S ribosomal protein S15a-1 [Dichanthelium oligosanthes]
MEGLIPFIYRAVVQFRKDGQVSFGDLFFDEPSPTSYFRLPGDSGRYQVTANDLFSRTAAVDSGSAGAMRRSPSYKSVGAYLCRLAKHGDDQAFFKGDLKFLLVMQKHGYIGEFEYVDDHRAGKIVVELNGRLNKCGVISPRFDVGIKEIEGWTARLLPSRQFGYIVLTTSAGIMDHEEARRKNVGGKVLGFFY